MLRRAPSLTDQVKTHIKELIIQGEFPGGRILAEMELAEVLGVSRTTVRDALSRLEMEGTISRRQGAGTFVNDPVLQIHSRLEEIWVMQPCWRPTASRRRAPHRNTPHSGRRFALRRRPDGRRPATRAG